MSQFDLRDTWTSSPYKAPIPAWSLGNPVGVLYHDIGAPGSFTVANHDQCLAWVAKLERDEETPGVHPWTYSACSYNLIVCPHGIVIEGRGMHVQSGAQANANSTWLAVLFMRNPSDPLLDAMKAGAAYARSLVLNSYPHATQQAGHRDVAGNPTGTICPSEIIEAWVRAGGAGSVSVDPTSQQRKDIPMKIVSPYSGIPSGRDAYADFVPELQIVMLHNGARLKGDRPTQDPRLRVWVPPRGHGTLLDITPANGGRDVVAIGTDPVFGDVTFRTSFLKG